MNLEILLKTITPLPWSTPHFALSQEHWDKVPTLSGLPKAKKSRCDCGYILCDSLMGAIATVHKGDSENEGDDPIGEAADANAFYLSHAANVFPEIVSALETARNALADCGQQDVENYPTFQKICRALEMAKNINAD